ncbi:hypothetical protein, partial [Mesorhizobium sp. M2E.F.Ca.ET.154.01.1.1]|uniref:hypothetical protein n=1 Tax=Mesorhizobium sp. M2E.F.Ca.ET.154.01.1.1 TaxID=2500521 RepID=UPI001AEDFD55
VLDAPSIARRRHLVTSQRHFPDKSFANRAVRTNDRAAKVCLLKPDIPAATYRRAIVLQRMMLEWPSGHPANSAIRSKPAFSYGPGA